MLGYDAARFIPKHSGSKKERLKINSKMTMELSILQGRQDCKMRIEVI